MYGSGSGVYLGFRKFRAHGFFAVKSSLRQAGLLNLRPEGKTLSLPAGASDLSRSPALCPRRDRRSAPAMP